MKFLSRIRDKISKAETLGSVQGIGIGVDEISVKLIKKKLFSDKPLVKIELVKGKYIETQWRNADLTISETEKLIELFRKSIEKIKID